MPGGDRTGPLGTGPGTGRGAGFCTGNDVPGNQNSLPFTAGRGAGQRFFGGRHGWRNTCHETGIPFRARHSGMNANAEATENELSRLKSQAEYFQNALVDIRKRIDEIEKEKK